MDDLLRHCLRELSFDGDLGCNVNRLKDFIIGCYENTEKPVGQNLDDAFCAFVWSLIVQHPTVQVGLKPPGITSEVWVAPQASAKRKVKAEGEESANVSPSKLIPIPNAKDRPLADLVPQYGDNLRIAIEPEATYAAITGTHIRSSKLSPMVYTALQIITRGRDNGVSVVELGHQTKYDQKTCFYLVKQLTELDLVMKVRRGGVGTHFCIHKYFFERSPSWRAIREEENEAGEGRKTEDKQTPEAGEELEGVAAYQGFTPIDARHLSSLPLIRARVIKLLQASKNHIHPSNNLLVTIGFANPTKTDRRFFQSRMRELLQQGLIEKVVVPSQRRKSSSAYVKCFRLVSQEGRLGDGEAISVPDVGDGKDEEGVKVNLTLHKQIVDLLEDAGPDGMTLQDLSTALCDFDKRTIELLLARAEKYLSPAHLRDLGIVSLMETSGRERRYRYYTTSSYQALLAKENFDSALDVSSINDFASVGGFYDFDATSFFTDQAALRSYQDAFKGKNRVGRPRKQPTKNPIMPDGRVKRGRPRKRPIEEVESKPSEIAEPAASTAAVPKPRPTKRRRVDTVQQGSADADQTPTPQTRGQHPTPKKTPLPNVKSRKRIRPEESSHTDKAGELRKRVKPSDPERDFVRSTLSSNQDVSADIGNLSGVVSVTALGTGVRDQQGKAPTDHETEGTVAVSKGIVRKQIPVITSPAAMPSGSSVSVDNGITTSLEGLAPLDFVPIDPELLAEQEQSSPVVQQAPKESPGVSRAKVNVSHLRRENELYRIITEQGGVVNIQSKEFYAAHRTLIESLSLAGEPTSAPVGTTIDKRTLATTLESLDRRGRVKQLKTSVATHTGASRPVSIVYLPDLPQDKLNDFLANLSRVQLPALPPSAYVKLNERVEFGADLPATHGSVLPLQLLQLEQSGEDKKDRWSKNVARAKQLFSYGDDTIRRVLLTERTTVAQFYGFIPGKIARAQHLHLRTLNAFDNRREIPGVICHEHRIVDLSYYCHEVPLELYCSLISVLAYDEGLKQFLKTAEGRQTAVRNLPAHLHSSLQIGRSRARSRFLEILEVLSLLGLVVPLQSSTSEEPSICCAHNDKYRAFEPAIQSDVSSNPSNCWWFCSQGPIHVWGLSEKSPPLWKQVLAATEAESQIYWRALHEACINPDVIHIPNPDSGVSLSDRHISLGRVLRRASSWAAEYAFTWHQTQYMREFIDVHTARTPLQEENDAARASKIGRISWVIGAPEENVHNFYSTNHTKLVLELEKARNRAKQRRSERNAKVTKETKALLARKAAEAKRQREEDWDKLLSRLHPLPLPTAAVVRVKRIRTRFMQATTIQNQEKWENEILAALREADLITKQLLRTSEITSTVRFTPAPSYQGPLNREKPVEALVSQQGPRISPRKNKGKRKGKAVQDADETKEKPRHRFQWNHDYDELARDASAIIKARCRALSRLDWGAFEQVFPAVPRNTVRQRLAHLRESPGNEAYLNRLEERWHELWLQYRGTPALPDDDPLSPTNFDLAKHIEFLRGHIDKNALRVGFAQSQEKPCLIIPTSVDELLDKYTVMEPVLSAPMWDFMWNATVEEGREKRLMRQSFTKNPEEVAMHANLSSELVKVAEATLKMTLGTPHERYDHEHASAMLKNLGDSTVGDARSNLLARGVLSKLVRDPQKQRPGRQLKISEINQNAIGGPVPRDTFHDAAALEELFRQDDGWRDWPLLATDGDAAALIEAVSNNQVRFKIDTTKAQCARPQLDWNSKKADDDQIETAISFQFDALTSGTLASPDLSDEINVVGSSSHTPPPEGTPRCCKGQALNGLVDCEKCLQEEWASISATLSGEEIEVAQKVREIVREAGVDGILKSRLRELKDSFHLTEIQLFDVVRQLTDAIIPVLFWAGYDSVVLVHSTFLENWTVVTSSSPLTRSYPRRWYDIAGLKISDHWQAALRAVVGVIVFRPGITQYELRWRLRSVYDRQEMSDILQHLKEENQVYFRQKDRSRYLVLPLDDEEEKEVFWFIGDRGWYEV